jgi:TatD DNase family protein|uniref:TatD family hydrolase n=1 Tax=Cephaloticoccus sp. TaxID=1985742 RepID=UPI00404A70B4
MGLIDTHTHLESFAVAGDLEVALARARTADLEAMIAIGTASDDWSPYRDIAAARLGFVHYSVGLHPCYVEANWADEVALLPGYFEAGQTLPVALGECGLDRFHLPKEATEAEALFNQQQAAFAAQLALAKSLNCPVVIHSRGAFAECLAMIDASGVNWNRVVFHCFAEGPTEMAQLMERGGRGSFTGIITYKSAENVRQAAKLQGLDRLMIETDAPYLAPVPKRGKPNEPAYVRHTAEFCAGLYGVGYDELAAITTRNARSFYGI